VLEPQTASGPGPEPQGVAQADSTAPSDHKEGSALTVVILCLGIAVVIIIAYILIYVYFYSKGFTALETGKWVVFFAGLEKVGELVYKALSTVFKQLKGLPGWLRAQWGVAKNNTVARIAGGAIIAAGIALPAAGVSHIFDPYTHTGFCLPGHCAVSFESFPDTAGEPARCVPAGDSDSYEVVEPNKLKWHPCISDAANYSNFVYQAQMTITSGDCGGLLFRTAEQKSDTYQFEVCANGRYYLYYYDAKGPDVFNPSTCTQPNGSKGSCALVNTTAVAVKQGPDRTNLLAVEANGSTLTLYVNHVLLTSVTDKKFTSGHIGVFAGAYKDPTNVTFSNLVVWPL
jgi:hypothetical protein